MTDDELVEGLRGVFGVDTGSEHAMGPDEEGRDRRVVALRVVRAPDGFDDLELTLEVDGEVCVSRLLVDRAWREQAGLDDVASYATFVRARWPSGLVGPGADHAADDDADRGPRRGPGQDELWRLLESALRADAAGVTRVGHGTLEVVGGDGDPFTVHVSPQDWRRVAAGREQDALDQLDDVIGSRWDDEEHVVLFRGAFHPSVRAELPPLRSRLTPA